MVCGSWMYADTEPRGLGFASPWTQKHLHMACTGRLAHKLYATREPLQSPEAAGVLAPTTFCARRLLGRRTAKPATIAHCGRHRLYDCAGLRMRRSVVWGTAADPPGPFARHHQRAHVVHDTGAHRARRPGDRGRRSVIFVAKFAQEPAHINAHA